MRWARDLIRFLPRTEAWDGSTVMARGLIFDRGFPTEIEIHPFVFLEYADLLFRLAPIRHIRFTAPYGQDSYLPGAVPLREDGTSTPFPLDEILAMRQLSRLDSFGFAPDITERCAEELLPADTWARIAQCPHLTRCLALDSGHVRVYRSVEDLATGQLTSKMLRLEPRSMVANLGECESSDFSWEHGEHTRTSFDETGRMLEKQHGYIPWLHPSHCPQPLYDLAYHVERGDLPKYKPGTPQMEEWYEIPVKVHERRRSGW